MRILGISAHHRDAAAALLVDNQVIAAAREEHFSGALHDPGLPIEATRFCLTQAGIQASDLDHVVFYEKPLRKFERVLVHQLRAYPNSARSFVHGAFAWLGDRLWIKNRLAKELGVDFESILFVPQQLALAANAYYTSPFAEAALLTIDDVGEWSSSLSGKASGCTIHTTSEIPFPDSLGFVVSAITQFLGFMPGHDEYIIETLAPFGKPHYADAFRKLIRSQDKGFAVDQSAFRYSFDSELLYSESLSKHLGPPRYSGDPLLISDQDSRHGDIACSLQTILGERVLALVNEVHSQTASTNLCLAGELARNRRLVAEIVKLGPFPHVFVPNDPGKSGGALGAALYAQHELNPDTKRLPLSQPTALGEAIGNHPEPNARTLPDQPIDEISRRLLAGQRIAWVRGRVEFGACSLNNRIVLALPSKANPPNDLPARLQRSEPFLPRRLAMTSDYAKAGLPTDGRSNLTDLLARAQIRVTPRTPALSQISESPDGTICPQVITTDSDPELHALLCEIGSKTDLPIVQIDDFALRGSPIVASEAAAVQALLRSRLDCLIVENRIYERRAM